MRDLDKRWQTLAASLVNYSLKVQPGEKVMIMMLEPETVALAEAVHAEVIKAGGYAQIQYMSEAVKHGILRYGTDEQIGWVPEIEAYGMTWADCYLGLRGAFNLDECFDVPAEKVALYQKAMGKVSTLRWQNTRWALVRVPNEHFAQQAHVSCERMMDLFFDACTLDWEAYKKENQRIADILDQGSTLRIVGRRTDFSFTFGDNRWVVMDNTENIPDGETYVTPKWESVEGHIYFELPATLGGKVMNGVFLTFEKGHVVKAEAETNEDFLRMIIENNENADRAGEVAFGTNPYIDICTTDVLIDEKIGGTMHMALGRPYDGSYSSPIHWDLIKDTRTDAEVYLDGRMIFKDGKFLI